MSPSSHPLLPPIPSSTASGSFSSRYFINAPHESTVFHPQPVGEIVSRATIASTGVGLVVSTVQNALQKHDRGALGVFTRTGGTIGFFAAMGFSFSAVQAVTANVRQSNDALNGVAGGCAAGFVAGIRARSLPMAVGSCAFIGATIGTFEAAGNSFAGFDTASLSRPEREEKRTKFFQKRPERPALGEEAAVAS